MKIDFACCTEEELWKFVGSHLNKNGIDAVLVGGSVVSIYSQGAYKSGDLDFIVLNLFKDGLEKCMADIGFYKKGRHFVHSQCQHLFVEFPPGPLGIGEDTKIVPDVHEDGGTIFKILSPTDCIKDRLASYIHFKSQECFSQAILVAKSQPFKMNKIKKWCADEKALFAFKEFCEALKSEKIKKKND